MQLAQQLESTWDVSCDVCGSSFEPPLIMIFPSSQDVLLPFIVRIAPAQPPPRSLQTRLQTGFRPPPFQNKVDSLSPAKATLRVTKSKPQASFTGLPALLTKSQ